MLKNGTPGFIKVMIILPWIDTCCSFRVKTIRIWTEDLTWEVSPTTKFADLIENGISN